METERDRCEEKYKNVYSIMSGDLSQEKTDPSRIL